MRHQQITQVAVPNGVQKVLTGPSTSRVRIDFYPSIPANTVLQDCSLVVSPLPLANQNAGAMLYRQLGSDATWTVATAGTANSARPIAFDWQTLTIEGEFASQQWNAFATSVDGSILMVETFDDCQS